MRCTFSSRIMFACFVICGLTACYEDTSEVTTIVVADRPQIIVSGDVALAVSDEEGNPVVGTLIMADGANYDGELPYSAVSLSEVDLYATTAILDHAEYGQTTFHLPVQPNDISYQSKYLVTDRKRAQISNSSSISVDLGQTEFRAESNAYQLNGQTYSGSLTITLFEREIERGEDQSLIPGLPWTIAEDGRPAALIVDILVHVRAMSSSNEELTFREGTTRLLLPDQGATPFILIDDGHWEAMEHSFVNGQIEVELTEAGYICLATSYESVLVSGTTTVGEQPIAHMEIQALRNNKVVTRTFSSNNGRWSMFLPAESEIDFRIVSHCGEVVNRSVNLDVVDEEIRLDLSDRLDAANISGEARDCDDEQVGQHFLTARVEDQSTSLYFNTPQMNIAVASCNDPIELQSTSSDWTATGPTSEWEGEDIDLQTTYICSELAGGYIAIRINDEHKIYEQTKSIRESASRIVLTANDATMSETEITIWIGQEGAGIVGDTDLNILLNIQGDEFEQGGYSVFCPTSEEGCGFEEFVITQYGNSGEWIRGYFSGRFWVKTLDPLTAGYKDISGEFQVRREF